MESQEISAFNFILMVAGAAMTVMTNKWKSKKQKRSWILLLKQSPRVLDPHFVKRSVSVGSRERPALLRTEPLI